MNGGWLEFERPILELEAKVRELRDMAAQKGMDAGREIESLEAQADRLREEVYSNLTPWQRVQLARHSKRPYTLDYIGLMCDDFTELMMACSDVAAWCLAASNRKPSMPRVSSAFR